MLTVTAGRPSAPAPDHKGTQMRTSRKLAATALAGTLLATALATGASADTVSATFEVTNTGGLAVSSASATAAMGTVNTASANTISAALPKVTVSDTRNPTLGSWTVKVDATSFTDGAVTPVTIAGTKVSYWSGAATILSGVVVPVGQQAAQVNAVTLDAQRDAVVATGAVGNNTVEFTPSLSVDVTGVPVGTYTGNVVHSVTGS